jgi:hypothetical protein
VPAKQPAGPPAAAKAPAAPPAAKKAQPKPAERPVDNDLYQRRLDIQKLLKADPIPADQQQLFDTYYKKYALARWTTSKCWATLPTCRNELRRDFRTARQSAAAHDHLLRLALDYLTEIAKNENSETGQKENYHWASRYNAMLAIGDLNAKEQPRPMENPVPYAEAFPRLLEAFTDPGQDDTVRAAALWGIKRHASLQAVADIRGLHAPLLALANANSAQGRTDEGHQWFRARAIDVLGVLRDVGDQNAVVTALVDVVGEDDGPLRPRRSAARGLGLFNYPANHGMDASQMAGNLGQLAVDACEIELVHIDEAKEKAEQEKRKASQTMYGGGYGGYEEGYPGEGYEEESYEEEPDYSEYDEYGEYGIGPTDTKEEEEEDETLNYRRRLLTYLNAVFMGMTSKEWWEWAEWSRKNENQPPPGGVASLTNQAQQQFVNDVLASVESLIKLCETESKAEVLGVKKPEDIEPPHDEMAHIDVFREKLQEKLADLRAALSNVGAAAPPPAKAPADAGTPTTTTGS